MFVVVSYDIRIHVPLTCFHHYLLVFALFIYLFLASSHQLYAELWLDFVSFAGPLGGRITSLAVLHAQMGDILLTCFSFIGIVLCCHYLGTYLHFCTYSTCFIFFCGLY